ncbi:response regulator [bacterium]|nr:response regulator [bacterium]MBU0900214.1 response regulator [bacterium]MBU1153712.1 response regulator [bacterium]MBU1782898.1 response regulator [bacterium]
MKKKKILVVDDEPYVVRSLIFVLKKEGYLTVSASNGEEALQKAMTEEPDLIFLDIMMPKINGYEVCKRLKEHEKTKGIYIIILTAKGQKEDKMKGVEVGVNEYITKPFSPSKVIQRMKEIFEDQGIC